MVLDDGVLGRSEHATTSHEFAARDFACLALSATIVDAGQLVVACAVFFGC